ncbi:MAG: TonB family protein [Colwellia sp.]|nr:TonB family protein [Colwellia sp.]
MNIFNKSINTLVICFILSLGIIPIEAATNETNLHHRTFTKELVDIVKSQINYPSFAVDYGIEGELTIQIKIDEKGNIIATKFIQRSGSGQLDRAVMRKIGRIQSFKRIPHELKLKEFDFEVLLIFLLLED